MQRICAAPINPHTPHMCMLLRNRYPTFSQARGASMHSKFKFEILSTFDMASEAQFRIGDDSRWSHTILLTDQFSKQSSENSSNGSYLVGYRRPKTKSDIR